MNATQTTVVLTLLSLFFFVSESVQMILKAELRSKARWKLSAAIVVLVAVLVRIIYGEWWFSEILPPAMEGLSNLVVNLALFVLFAACLIVSGDFIIHLFKTLRGRIVTRRK